MRIAVQKTLKLYIGGAFVRSESGRTLPFRSNGGMIMHASRASRKDLRDTVGKARAAQPGWWSRTAYNRGQILYRLAEMLEDRADALPTSAQDRKAAIDRAVHHAGWTDKVTALLSSLNPVGGSYVNYSMVHPVGVVLALPRPEQGLLGMVEAVAAPLVMGNAVLLVVPAESAELAAAFSEALATSDLPAGVANVLTGEVSELVEAANLHDDIDTFWIHGSAVPEQALAQTQTSAARMVRRIVTTDGASEPTPPDGLARLCEIRTVWMSS